MVETFKACFNPISNVASKDRLVKWNKNNHFSVILNVGGSCIGSPCKSWIWWVSWEIMLAFTYQVFWVIFTILRISFKLSYLLFI